MFNTQIKEIIDNKVDNYNYNYKTLDKDKLLKLDKAIKSNKTLKKSILIKQL